MLWTRRTSDRLGLKAELLRTIPVHSFLAHSFFGSDSEQALRRPDRLNIVLDVLIKRMFLKIHTAHCTGRVTGYRMRCSHGTEIEY